MALLLIRLETFFPELAKVALNAPLAAGAGSRVGLGEAGTDGRGFFLFTTKGVTGLSSVGVFWKESRRKCFLIIGSRDLAFGVSVSVGAGGGVAGVGTASAAATNERSKSNSWSSITLQFSSGPLGLGSEEVAAGVSAILPSKACNRRRLSLRSASLGEQFDERPGLVGGEGFLMGLSVLAGDFVGVDISAKVGPALRRFGGVFRATMTYEVIAK